MPMNKREQEIVFAAMHGNTQCFEELYKLYYEKIYALALTMTKNSADAEDVLQTVFVSAWKNIDSLENPAAFSTWLQRITVNRCNSLLRRRRPYISTDDEGEDGEVMQLESELMLPEQYAERDDLSLRLQSIINELSDVQRETVMLYYFSEMTIEEISVIMDCSEGTVKSRLYLARKALKTEIEEQERKTGEKFYGAVCIPFGSVFVKQVNSTMISKGAAMNLFQNIASTVFGVPPVQYAPAHGSSVPGRAASAGARHGARYAASTAAKSSFPLWAKITAAVLAVAIVVTGGVIAAIKLIPKNDASQTESGEANGAAAAATEEGYAVPSYEVGETIVFGKYEQDNNTANGAEDITWRILDNTDGKIFVVSEYALDSLSYDDYAPGEYWSEAGLRDYLNDDFFHSAFNEDEQRCVADTYVLSDTQYDVAAKDSVVIDKVFLLSKHETGQYFSSDEDAVAYATEYAKAKGADTDEENKAVWWLRLCVNDDPVGVIDNNGSIDTRNGDVKCALRPAMWIDTNAIGQNQDAESVVQPIDTSYINKSLHNFLPDFYVRGYNLTTAGFDSEKQDQTNILYYILSWSYFNYDTYFEGMYESRYISAAEEPSPIDAINNKEGATYQAFEADKIDWIAKNIFQCTDEDIEHMRSKLTSDSERFPCGYSDGMYYDSRGRGEPEGRLIHYKWIDGYQKDGYCYFTLDGYWSTRPFQKRDTVDFDSPADVRVYAKVKLLSHEGTPWWSLYYLSDEPFDEWENVAVPETEPEPEETADDWSSMYYSYLTENDKPLIWSDSSNSINVDTPVALHDFDMDGVPELILGYPGARLGLSVYTIYGGEVVNAGGIGGKSSFYSDDASYHGIFRGDTIKSGAEGGVYYSGLSDGKLVTTEVYSFEYNMDTKEPEFTINDETLYDVYLECTDSPSYENATFREPRNTLKMDNWSNIQSNGWDSFTADYGY